MNQDEAFIGDILAAPRDDSPRLAYAGWLDQRDRARGNYLRAEMQWVQAREARLEAELGELATNLDAVWVARVSRPPVGVCADHLEFREPESGTIRPKLTEADLDWIERRFHIMLPADYRGFLLNDNGGWATPSHFRIPGRAYGDWEYEVLLRFGTVWAAAESKIEWFEFDVRPGLPGLRPVGHRGGTVLSRCADIRGLPRNAYGLRPRPREGDQGRRRGGPPPLARRGRGPERALSRPAPHFVRADPRPSRVSPRTPCPRSQTLRRVSHGGRPQRLPGVDRSAERRRPVTDPGRPSRPVRRIAWTHNLLINESVQARRGTRTRLM